MAHAIVTMGTCCTKPIDESTRDRATLILHAYHDLPNCANGQLTRKRRGSFVLFEHHGPLKKIRTNEMIACLEEYLDAENEEKK